MASRMKEDERNEKIIRSLLKLPPNRKCINCNSLGPQYVCTNFWTFVCTTCSGIHREFTHRVKSVSMAKFTSQEVTSLQQGGNQKAKEIYFKDFDPQRHQLPDSSNVDRLRDFIKHVYVDKRYSGDKGGDRPPRGKTGDRDDTSESRRPDSFRSDSRSPPYEDEYGDRRYGDRSGSGARKFDYDRSRYDDRGYEDRRYGYDERRSPGQYESDRSRYDRNVQDNRRYDDTYKRSPTNFESGSDKRFDDRSGNGSQNRRFEDRRYPDTPDRRRPEEQSPNYQRDYDINSPPPIRPVRDILGDDVPTLRVSDFPRANGSRDIEGSTRSLPEARREFRGQRTASSSSMGSVEGNSPNLNRVNSGSLIDFSAEPEPPTATAQQDPFGVSSITQPSTATTQQDLFSVSSVKQQSTAAQQDPFVVSSVSKQSSAVPQVISAVSQPSGASASNNGGWATFDFAAPAATPVPVQSLAPVPAAAAAPVPAAAAAPVGPIAGQSAGIIDSFGNVSNAGQWSAQWSATPQVQGPATSVSGGNNWSAFPQSVQPSSGVSDSLSWNTLLSSAAPAPPKSSQNVQPTQPATKPPLQGQGQGQQPSGSTQNGRNELPEDLFKLPYPEPVLHNTGFQLGSQFGGVSGVQYPSVGVSLPGPVPYYNPPSKSTNPFDIAGELPATQGSTFPSMGSLQAALPISNTAPLAAPGSGHGAFNTQWTPSMAPSPYQPAASGLYMGQQVSNAFLPKAQSGATPPITSFPSGSFPSDDLFFNLGASRLSSQSSLPSVGGNPFG